MATIGGLAQALGGGYYDAKTDSYYENERQKSEMMAQYVAQYQQNNARSQQAQKAPEPEENKKLLLLD